MEPTQPQSDISKCISTAEDAEIMRRHNKEVEDRLLNNPLLLSQESFMTNRWREPGRLIEEFEDANGEIEYEVTNFREGCTYRTLIP